MNSPTIEIDAAEACRVLNVPRSDYYDRLGRPASLLQQENELLVKHIKQIHADSRETYGSPRIHAELTLGLGLWVNLKWVTRLIRAAGTQGLYRRRRRSPPSRSSTPGQTKIADPTPEMSVLQGSSVGSCDANVMRISTLLPSEEKGLAHQRNVNAQARDLAFTVEVLAAYSHSAQAADLRLCHTAALTSPVLLRTEREASET